MKWLKSLIEKVKAFSLKDNPSQEPSEEVREDEKILGVLSPTLQQFFSYYGSLADQLKAMVDAHVKEHESPNHTVEMCKQFHKKLEPLKEDLDLVKTIFWKEAREEFKNKADGIGIRKGWKVVGVSPRSVVTENRLRIIRSILDL